MNSQTGKIRNSVLYCLLLLLFAHLPGMAQRLDGQAAVGQKPVSIAGDFALQASGKLFLQSYTLHLKGNYRGENGSIHIPVKDGVSGFFDISGTANGASEIIPDFQNEWDGSRINLVKAKSENSNVGAFQMQEWETDGFRMQLKHETQGNSLIWFIEKTEINACLPLIVQLSNHTLLVNNNTATNGGYKFEYYRWYKNGVLLKEGAHVDNGGSYYTGGVALDENADYTVEVIDSTEKHYLSCPYRFVPFTSPVNVFVYPNPVSRNAKAYIQAETQDLTLLDNAVVEIYDLAGQHTGKVQINGQTVIPLDLPAKSGFYMLKFKGKDFIQTIKLIVE
jgi:hypothetical protein